HQANKDWSAAEPLLRRAMSRVSETANRRSVPSSFGIRRQSCSSVKDRSECIEVVDAVAARREPRRDAALAVRTPWL
ncbi:hypothetical protein, partial [Desulfobotulus mexicanus]|uniref:hypothetical protein n=1 Tax=Desulfobotulus mexicanus TaxID=2586642 RepID=UPI001C558FC1